MGNLVHIALFCKKVVNFSAFLKKIVIIYTKEIKLLEALHSILFKEMLTLTIIMQIMEGRGTY